MNFVFRHNSIECNVHALHLFILIMYAFIYILPMVYTPIKDLVWVFSLIAKTRIMQKSRPFFSRISLDSLSCRWRWSIVLIIPSWRFPAGGGGWGGGSLCIRLLKIIPAANCMLKWVNNSGSGDRIPIQYARICLLWQYRTRCHCISLKLCLLCFFNTCYWE